MSGFTFFVKPCPACGRNTRIALAYLGKQVRCRHCSRIYNAADPEAQSEALNDPVEFWMNFSDLEIDRRFSEKFESRLPR
jgi:hypothetical protein